MSAFFILNYYSASLTRVGCRTCFVDKATVSLLALRFEVVEGLLDVFSSTTLNIGARLLPVFVVQQITNLLLIWPRQSFVSSSKNSTHGDQYHSYSPVQHHLLVVHGPREFQQLIVLSLGSYLGYFRCLNLTCSWSVFDGSEVSDLAKLLNDTHCVKMWRRQSIVIIVRNRKSKLSLSALNSSSYCRLFSFRLDSSDRNELSTLKKQTITTFMRRWVLVAT